MKFILISSFLFISSLIASESQSSSGLILRADLDRFLHDLESSKYVEIKDLSVIYHDKYYADKDLIEIELEIDASTAGIGPNEFDGVIDYLRRCNRLNRSIIHPETANGIMRRATGGINRWPNVLRIAGRCAARVGIGAGAAAAGGAGAAGVGAGLLGTGGACLIGYGTDVGQFIHDYGEGADALWDYWCGRDMIQ